VYAKFRDVNGSFPAVQGYWTDPWSLFFVEVILVQFAELKRWQDYRYPGSQGKQYFLGLEKVLGGSGNPSYPGTIPRQPTTGKSTIFHPIILATEQRLGPFNNLMVLTFVALLCRVSHPIVSLYAGAKRLMYKEGIDATQELVLFTNV
jgi:hypothetical protein